MLAPCLHDIPEALMDQVRQHAYQPHPTRTLPQETRTRQRHLDMLVNPTLHKSLATRAKMLQFTRRFLDERGFTEVETPILSSKVGGAVARPFTTRANALGEAMSMRIAPELFLKVNVMLFGLLAHVWP